MNDRVNTPSPDPPLPILPKTWRPLRGRLVPYLLAVVIVVGSVVLAVAVPPDFRIVDRIGLALFGLLIAIGLGMLGRCRISADARGLVVVNIIRRRALEWPEVIDVNMPPGEPWPTLDLADGTTMAAMGIQATDGARARAALADLRALLRRHGEATEGR